MNINQTKYPVVDVFAGPGGLGEGFASAYMGRACPPFQVVLSLERDEFAHKTLFLRHFLRYFPADQFPDEYYAYLKSSITLDEVYGRYPNEFAKAQRSAPRLSIEKKTHGLVTELIKQRLADKKKWVLVGGPPCQAYSLAGRSRMMNKPGFEDDPRHFLYREYLAIISSHRPPVFVMENVKGLLSAKVDDESIIQRIVSDLSSPKSVNGMDANGLSYRLYSLSEQISSNEDIDPRMFLVKAEEYGVPQARHRMFIVGVRNDLKVEPCRLRRDTPLSVDEVIGDFPKIRSGLSRGNDSYQNWQNEILKLSGSGVLKQLNGHAYAKDVANGIHFGLNDSTYPQERVSTRYPGKLRINHPTADVFFDPRLNVLTGHESRGHMASDLRRYRYASVFAQVTGKCPRLTDFPASLLPTHQNVNSETPNLPFSDRFRVQLPNQAATTITSHISKDGHYYIHYDPTQCRSLTVREAARLQTFPDNYSFEGPRTAMYHQVGNAVPPYLARQIAEIIADTLDAMGNPD
ncbi:MAG: DNA cytosine methyltransferase [Gammaproteobacteria bacterium]|nr:DNA cytosine methyltransferase [Gammaproteobacteria bacterium]